MLRKIIDSLSYVGLAGLGAGYIYYSVHNQWDWKAQVLVFGGAALVLIYLGANFRKIQAASKTRTVRYGSAAGATVLLVLGILVLLNFLNFRHHRRVDLTENQFFSISDQSRKVAGNLKADVRVMGFFQDEARGRSFEDLVKEYRYASARIQYEVVDPQKDPSKVTQYNVQRDRQVVVASGAKTETIDDATEEKITNAIIKVTREGEKLVYFLQGHGERDVNDTKAQGFSAAREGIQKQNYQVKTYNLAQENKLPENAALIVSAGPQVNFFPTEVELLKQYLAGGGKFLLMVDPRTDFSMNDFLSQYGLNLGGNVVIDTSGIGQLFGLGPAAPLVAEYTDHPVTRELKGIMTFFPLAQSVSTTSSSLGYETKTLLSTSSRSWGETNLEGNQAAFDEGKDAKGPLHLAAAATRVLEKERKPDSEEGDNSRFVLFGDSDFASNGYFESVANGDLFLMVINWLAEDTDLLAIRPKRPEERRVNLSLSESRWTFWGIVVLLPLATLVFGINVWYRRR